MLSIKILHRTKTKAKTNNVSFLKKYQKRTLQLNMHTYIKMVISNSFNVIRLIILVLWTDTNLHENKVNDMAISVHSTKCHSIYGVWFEFFCVKTTIATLLLFTMYNIHQLYIFLKFYTKIFSLVHLIDHLKIEVLYYRNIYKIAISCTSKKSAIYYNMHFSKIVICN